MCKLPATLLLLVFMLSIVSGVTEAVPHLCKQGVNGPRSAQLRPVLGKQAGEVTSVAFSPIGNILATGGADHSVTIWDVDSGEMLSKLSELSGEAELVAFSRGVKT